MYIPGIYLSRFTIKMYYIVKGSFEKKNNIDFMAKLAKNLGVIKEISFFVFLCTKNVCGEKVYRFH